jgi:hypothetical protein
MPQSEWDLLPLKAKLAVTFLAGVGVGMVVSYLMWYFINH